MAPARRRSPTAALDRQKAITRHGMDAFIEQVCHDCFLPCAYGNAYKYMGSESKDMWAMT